MEFQKTDFLSPSFFKRLQGQLVAFFGYAFSPPYVMPFELKLIKVIGFTPSFLHLLSSIGTQRAPRLKVLGF
jgi:hypothetical protein